MLKSSYTGEAWDLEQVLQIAAPGRTRVTTNRISLDDVLGAYAQQQAGKHEFGRTVAAP